MKTLHISLSITLFFITNIAFSQYKGGSGDGSVLFTSPLTYLDGSLRTALFYGGDGDGFAIGRDSSIYLDGVYSYAHYLGGNGDGFNIFRAKDYYVDGTTIGDSYRGGDGDGGETSAPGRQFLEGSILATAYQGGAGDGFDYDTISFRFLDGTKGCAIYNLVAGETDSVVNGTYSQDITVYYTFDPGVGNLIVNNQNFPITGSPQQVTLTGLNPDGMPVDVMASFSDLSDCNTTEFALFIAPDTSSSMSIYAAFGAPEVKFSSRPNPFSSEISFSIQMDRTGEITLDLMTFSGQMISSIYEGNVSGNQVHEVRYDGSQLPAGMYLGRLKTNGHVYYKKLVKLK